MESLPHQQRESGAETNQGKAWLYSAAEKILGTVQNRDRELVISLIRGLPDFPPADSEAGNFTSAIRKLAGNNGSSPEGNGSRDQLIQAAKNYRKYLQKNNPNKDRYKYFGI